MFIMLQIFLSDSLFENKRCVLSG